MAPNTKASAEASVQKRLHIGGLTNPKITHLDLEKRFASFGQVEGVEGVGIDANGDPRTYAYLSLTTTPAQLNRCMSLLSGSTWKRSLLKIGEAKQHYAVRLEGEREAMKRPLEDADANTNTPAKKKKPLKLGRGVKGVEAKNMDLVDVDNVEGRKNWHVTPLDHLIRPLIFRPPHPVPPPTLALPPAPPPPAPKVHKRPKPAKPLPPPKKKKTGKGGTKAAPPPVRSRMIVIDPRRYERTHLGAGMLDAGEVDQERGWICVDAEEGEKGVVRWVRQGPNGEELGSEEVLVGKKRVDEVLKVLSRLHEQQTGHKTEVKDVEMKSDEDEEEFQPLDFDDDASDDGEDDWVPLHDGAQPSTGSPSLFSNTDLPAVNSSAAGPSSPLFTSKKLPSAIPAASKPTPAPAPVATKPVPAAKAAPKPTPAPKAAAAKPAPASKPAAPAEVDPLESAFLEEKSRGLDVLKGLFEGGWSPEPMSPPAGVEALPGGIIYNSDDEDHEIPRTRQPVKLYEEIEEVAVPVAVAKKAAKVVVEPEVVEKKSVSFAGVPALDEAEDVVVGEVDEGYEEDVEDEEEVEDEAELDPIELAMRELRGWGGSESEGEGEETEDATNVIRPRGGAGSASSSSDEDSSSEDEDDSSASSSSSSSSSEDEGEDVPMVAADAPEPAPAAASPPPAPKPTKKPNALRDLFAPQAASSSGGLFGSSSDDTPFSLLSSLPLDLDLDPASDPTLSASLPIPAPLPASSSTSQPRTQAQQPEMASGTTMTATFKPDPSIPYFFPFLHLSESERAKGPKQQARSVVEMEREREGGGVGGFWRTQTEEEMQARWETDHLELTREYKKRHREAVKRRRRRGAVDGEEDGEGNAVGDN